MSKYKELRNTRSQNFIPRFRFKVWSLIIYIETILNLRVKVNFNYFKDVKIPTFPHLHSCHLVSRLFFIWKCMSRCATLIADLWMGLILLLANGGLVASRKITTRGDLFYVVARKIELSTESQMRQTCVISQRYFLTVWVFRYIR